MSNVIAFSLRRIARREHALNWLAANISEFPTFPGKNKIGKALFHGWHFAEGLDGVVYFANWIYPGITESELQEFRGTTAA